MSATNAIKPAHLAHLPRWMVLDIEDGDIEVTTRKARGVDAVVVMEDGLRSYYCRGTEVHHDECAAYQKWSIGGSRRGKDFATLREAVECIKA